MEKTNKKLCKFIPNCGRCYLYYRTLYEDSIVVVYSFGVKAQMSVSEMAGALMEFEEYIRNLYAQAECIVNYPGIQNPILAQAMLDAVKSKGYDYKIMYNKESIEDEEDFSKNILSAFCVQTMDWTCSPLTEATFHEFSLCVAIKPGCRELSPWRYYTIDSEGVLTSESFEKPKDEKFLESMCLRERFKNEKLKLVKGSLVGTPINS
jgi:hypothetical protein